jgi:MFS family permease
MPDPGRPRDERGRLRRVVPAAGPVRTLTKSTLANTIGNGLYMTIEVIFFTRSVGLSNHDVAIGLGVAAAVALLAGIPAGHLADRRGPRELGAAFLLLEGVAMAAFVLVHDVAGFVLVASAEAVFGAASSSVRRTLIARFGVGEERVRIQAYQRSVTNFGISIGMIFAGAALAIDTRDAYVAMVLGNAVTFVIAAAFVLQLPAMAPTAPPVAGGPRTGLVVLRDGRYLLATALNGLFAIHFMVQSVGLPLWILQHTHAPRWWVAVLLIINTTMVILFQVRLSRGTGELAVAARAFRRAGLLIALACILYGASDGLNAPLAAALLVLAMLVHTGGELLSSGASWGIGYGMARERVQGQYQGAYSMGRGLSGILGPPIVIGTAVSLGRVGWVVLAALFALTGAAFAPLVRAYERALERAA